MRIPVPAAHRVLMVLISAACTSASPRPSANSPVGLSLVIGFFALIGRSPRNATAHCGAMFELQVRTEHHRAGRNRAHRAGKRAAAGRRLIHEARLDGFSGRVESSSLFSVPGPLREDCCKTTGITGARLFDSHSDGAAKTSVPAPASEGLSHCEILGAHKYVLGLFDICARESIPMDLLIRARTCVRFSFDTPDAATHRAFGLSFSRSMVLTRFRNTRSSACHTGRLLQHSFKRRSKIFPFTTEAHDSFRRSLSFRWRLRILP